MKFKTLIVLLIIGLVGGCATLEDVAKHLVYPDSIGGNHNTFEKPDAKLPNHLSAQVGKRLPTDITLLQGLAEKGDAEAQYQLADRLHYGEGVAKDYAQCFKWASRSASQGNSKAQFRLASLYFLGRGIPKDEERAKALFTESKGGLTKLAKQNDPKAQFALGVMYARGLGVVEDDKESVKWFHKAAKQGDINACSNLGVMYATG
ncbi:uncharacterized protein METZ01_LOCUS340978, partial [marine metagenome]